MVALKIEERTLYPKFEAALKSFNFTDYYTVMIL